MVVACQGYISEDGTMKVWDIPSSVLLERISACDKLFEGYQKCFLQVKQKSQGSSQEQPLEVSEMYVFGKFKNFCKRLNRIQRMVVAVENFSVLGKTNIEGMEQMNSRFQTIFSQAKKKNYNILDPRKHEFEVDFAEFQRQMAELEVSVHALVYLGWYVF